MRNSPALSKELSLQGIPRRLFLKMTGVLFFMAKIPASIYAYFVENLLERTVETGKFRFDPDTGLIQWEELKPEKYLLAVDGLVRTKRKFSYEELSSFPQVEQIADFHCVEGWSVQDILWGGFRFSEILKRVDPDPAAAYVVFHSLGKTDMFPGGQEHYIESYPVSELLDPSREILLVLRMNRKPLPEDHGAPLRLVSPYDLGYKSIKFIKRMEFTRKPHPGWWTLANPIYPMEARVPVNRLRKKR